MIRPTRSKPTEDKREYPDFITSEERDKVINALLKGTVNSQSVTLEYEDIPDLKISPYQYMTVIEGLKEGGYIKENGYSHEYFPKDKLHKLRERGGFHGELILFQSQLEQLYLSLKEDDRNDMDKFFKSMNTKLETVTKTHEVFELFKKAAAVFIGD